MEEQDKTTVAERRKIYIIDREFQFKYLTTWLIMLFGFVAIIFFLMFMGLKVVKSGEEYVKIQKDIGFVLAANAIVIILLTIFLGLYMILLSHRIAGPAYRIKVCLKRMCEGDYDFTCKLRRHDYLTEIADGLNSLLENLRKNKTAISNVNEEIKKIIEEMKNSGQKDIFSMLNNIQDELQTVLTQKKVENTKEKDTSHK